MQARLVQNSVVFTVLQRDPYCGLDEYFLAFCAWFASMEGTHVGMSWVLIGNVCLTPLAFLMA